MVDVSQSPHGAAFPKLCANFFMVIAAGQRLHFTLAAGTQKPNPHVDNLDLSIAEDRGFS